MGSSPDPGSIPGVSTRLRSKLSRERSLPRRSNGVAIKRSHTKPGYPAHSIMNSFRTTPWRASRRSNGIAIKRSHTKPGYPAHSIMNSFRTTPWRASRRSNGVAIKRSHTKPGYPAHSIMNSFRTTPWRASRRSNGVAIKRSHTKPGYPAHSIMNSFRTTPWRASRRSNGIAERSRKPSIHSRVRSEMDGFHYVYILVSDVDQQRHYTGFTSNLDERLKAHNAGQVPHTSKFRPWRIETVITFRSREKACAFEKYLKSHSGRAFATKHF